MSVRITLIVPGTKLKNVASRKIGIVLPDPQNNQRPLVRKGKIGVRRRWMVQTPGYTYGKYNRIFFWRPYNCRIIV